MQCLAIFALVALKFSYVTCIPQANLTSDPAVLEGLTCPRIVELTCIGQDIPVLRWFFDQIGIASYAHTVGDENSLPLDVDSSIDIGSIQIISVEASTTVDGINATSILSTNISILEKFNNIQCGSNEARSNLITVNVTVLGSAPSPFEDTADCSLVSSVGNTLNISLQWSPSFNSQYNVEMYNLTVTPDLSPSCSGLVPPSENYSCSGLDPETDYFITASAINCGNQMGERASFNLQPLLLAPKPPQDIKVMSNIIEWMESLTSSGNCSFTGAINYTLTLVDSTGRMEERRVSSDSCVDGSCSTTISPSSQSCSVSIVASNAFGSSNTAATSIDPPRLTSTNKILLGLGVVLFCMAIAGVCAFIVMMKVKKIRVSKLSKWFLILLLCGVLLLVVSAVLWVAVGFQAGLQDSTCDETWQTARDGLIISSFAFSLVSVLTVIAAIFVAKIVSNEGKRSKISLCCESGRENISGKRPPKSIDEHGREVSKPDKPRELDLYDDFRNKGEEYKEGKFRVLEEKHQQTTELYSKPNFNIPQQHGQDPPTDHFYSHFPVIGDGASGKVGEQVYDDLDRGNEKMSVPPPDLDHQDPSYSHLLGKGTETNEEVEVENDSHDNDEQKGGGFAPVSQRPCTTLCKYNKYWHQLKSPPPPEQLAEWFPSDRAWQMEDLTCGQLVVYIMDNAKEMTKLIMPTVNDTWKNFFIVGVQESSNIRIKFEDTSDNWSALGSVAKTIPKDKPTMVLNFSNMEFEEIKATILHQFGHAMGLGHALMKPDDWEVLKPYLDTRAMMEFYGSPSLEEFEVQWTGKGLDDGVVNYDEGSIMRYSTNLLWLKEETYRDTQGVNSVKDADAKRKLKIFLKHASSVQTTPSTDDLITLNEVHPAMSVDNLLQLRNSAKKEDSLTWILATNWYTIGEMLGVKKSVLIGIDKQCIGLAKLEHVWQEWYDPTDETSHLEKYPFTWNGLRALFIDMKRKDIADKFLPFLDAL